MATQAHLSIGGLDLCLDGSESLRRALSLPGFDRFSSSTAPRHPLRISLDRHIDLPDCRWLHRFDLAEGQAEARFGIDIEGVYFHTFGNEGTLRFDSRQPDEVLCSGITQPDVLRFALWTAYSLAGLWHSALPIHASAVVYRDKAVPCLGESGTGKSTHTRLWVEHIEGCHLLNDDSPILSVADGTARLYGSPWSGKTPCYRQENFPVAALLRLEQAPHNSIRQLGTIEAFGALQPSCPPALAHDERCLDRIAAFLSTILEHTPVYRLQCLPDAEAAHLSFNTIYNT